MSESSVVPFPSAPRVGPKRCGRAGTSAQILPHGRKTILVVSPTPTHPQTAGNAARVFALVRSMRQMGHDVHFMHVRKEPGDEAAMRAWLGDRFIGVPYLRPPARLRRLARRVLKAAGSAHQYRFGIDEWYDPAIDRHARAFLSGVRPDAVMVEYVYLSKVLECFPDTVHKLLDTHDVFTDRHRRYLANGERPQWFSTSAREEARALGRAHTVIAIQDEEAGHFRRACTRPVITVGHIVGLTPPSTGRAGDPRVLIVGSNNTINVQSLDRFLQRVWPQVHGAVAGAELALAGSLSAAGVGAPGLVRLGIVPDLVPAYRSARVVVNPTTFGTGLKVKTIEALGQSKAVVTTPAGAQGLETGAGVAFEVAETPEEMAEKIVRLLHDPGAAARLGRAAYQFAAQWNRGCLAQLRAVLARGSASGTRPGARGRGR